MLDPLDKEMPGADDWQAEADHDREIARLAGLDTAAYEAERRLVAKELGFRPAVLDQLVKAARRGDDIDDDGKQGQRLRLPEIEPWPEAVDGQALFARLQDAITRYVVLSDHEALACALWVLHAHAHDWFFISPTLHISSPEKQCGKSTLLSVLGPMVPRHLPTENASTASFFRVIEAARPTLIMDEADTFLKDNEDLRGILNASHQKGGSVLRTVGDDHEPRSFSVWCPVVIAGIGRISATLEDRSIQIQLNRRKSGEAVERMRLDRRGHLADLGRMAARWVADCEQEIRAGDPGLPEELSDRGQDNWRPLVTIADTIGSECGERARAAAIAISGLTGDDESSAKVMALSDLWGLFEKSGVSRLSTVDILKAFNEMEDRPWPEWRRGKEMTGNSLARLLKPFGIRPASKRFGSDTAKGYERADLADAYQRYVGAPNVSAVPTPSNPSVTPSQTNEINELDGNQTVTSKSNVTDGISHKPLKNNDCYGVTDENPGKGQVAHVSGEIAGAGDPVADDWGNEL